MRDIRIDLITIEHVRDLQTNNVREGRQLDYKRDLPGRDDKAKRELLADASAFANTVGGDIVWGIEELKDETGNTGLIGQVVGLKGANIDAEVLRMEGILRTGLQPRLANLRFHQVDGGDDGPLLVLRIPRSVFAPHAVVFDDYLRFWYRTNVGKAQLDVRELRAAFLESESAKSRPARFRLDRLAKIQADELPVPLRPGARLCIHIVPLGDHALALTKKNTEQLRPIRAGGDGRPNFDGWLSYGPNAQQPRSYVQLFRDGSVEAVEAALLNREGGPVPSGTLEWETAKAMNGYVVLLRSLGVDSPLAAFVTLLGIRGLRMGVSQDNYHYDREDARYKFDRDDLLLPELVVEGDSVSGTDLRPVFNVIWQASGWEQSIYYDAEGNWKPEH